MEELKIIDGRPLKKRVTILIADDHKPLRRMLRIRFEKEKDLSVVGEAGDGIEAVKLAHKISPDIIVMDINMPHKNGIVATKEIISREDTIRIIGLSFHDDEVVRNEMLDAGAAAFHSKSDDMNSLCSTIRRVGNKNFAA